MLLVGKFKFLKLYIFFLIKKKLGWDCLKVKKSENNFVDSWKVEG